MKKTFFVFAAFAFFALFGVLLLAGCAQKKSVSVPTPAPSILVVTEYATRTPTATPTPKPTRIATVEPSLEPSVEASPSPTVAFSESPVSISIKDSAFVPDVVRIKLGAKIVWTNEDSATHIIASDSETFSSMALQNGDKYEHFFASLGTYTYYCSLHPDMTGKIIVE